MALKLDPDDIASHFRTAVVLIEEGRFSQAETCLDAANRLSNLQPMSRYNLDSIASLWTELAIDIKNGANTSLFLTPKRATKWFEHIKICASKSNNALKTVRRQQNGLVDTRGGGRSLRSQAQARSL
ncbi:hypothetical protein NDA11_003454 [Ustilago hordei]|uniref:Uncharacterized protein n=1 Tax=Ustilago hordei TaxID=120017 RepID=I2FZB9_USTHO|nr:uncharacterized protein UHO2_03149 [Ustilago hordei]KAJ1045155.1 hypothetical protein NDA10_002679 [Ustilago hordei]KAJ1576993.1 hypothetical protein NDA15_004796 [Ustilago hordei]KAJ1578483.1 hypothetical protein NDA12_000240 [Ustilago hordei]KAJ1584060.1 hypothetical protein NDA11_003454 [Ustilago hordei]KAJ1599081.1 hypothetical protein NDA14_001379 [Ustilago hordei]